MNLAAETDCKFIPIKPLNIKESLKNDNDQGSGASAIPVAIKKKDRHDQSHLGRKDLRFIAKKGGSGKYNWGNVKDQIELASSTEWKD